VLRFTGIIKNMFVTVAFVNYQIVK